MRIFVNFINGAMTFINILSFLLLIPFGLYWLASRRSPDSLEAIIVTAIAALIVLTFKWSRQKSSETPKPFDFKSVIRCTLWIVFVTALILICWLPPKPTGRGVSNPPAAQGPVTFVPEYTTQFCEIHYDREENDKKFITITVYKDNKVYSQQTVTGKNPTEYCNEIGTILKKADAPEYKYDIGIKNFLGEQIRENVRLAVEGALGKNRCDISIEEIY